jgi:hypothetical protein
MRDELGMDPSKLSTRQIRELIADVKAVRNSDTDKAATMVAMALELELLVRGDTP